MLFYFVWKTIRNRYRGIDRSSLVVDGDASTSCDSDDNDEFHVDIGCGVSFCGGCWECW